MSVKYLHAAVYVSENSKTNCAALCVKYVLHLSVLHGAARGQDLPLYHFSQYLWLYLHIKRVLE